MSIPSLQVVVLPRSGLPLLAGIARAISTPSTPTLSPFTVAPAEQAPKTLAWVEEILASERDIRIASRPLEVAVSDVDRDRFQHRISRQSEGSG